MSPLEPVVEQLFAHPGSELVLESDSTGYFLTPDGQRTPAFRHPLRTGQVLLLFADVVPPSLSTAMLEGQRTTFTHRVPGGLVEVDMLMQNHHFQARVRAVPLARAAVPPPLRAVTEAGALLPSTPPAVPPVVPPVAPVTSAGATSAPRRELADVVALLPGLWGQRVSHLHVAPGQVPLVRVDGVLRPLEGATVVTPEAVGAAWAALDGLDPGRSVHGVGEVLVHVLGSAAGFVVELHALAVPTPEALGLPAQLVAALQGGGLWLVAGQGGHGRSTTLAALAQAVLAQRCVSVAVVSARPAFWLGAGQGVVRHLEAPTVAQGLEQVAAADADLVVVDGLDDAASWRGALGWADRGALVLASTYARHAVAAVEKAMALAGGDAGGLHLLASGLKGVFAQSLVRRETGGRALAWELLPAREAVRHAIRDRQPANLPAQRARTLDKSLVDLVANREVAAADALAAAVDREWLEAHLPPEARARAA